MTLLAKIIKYLFFIFLGVALCLAILILFYLNQLQAEFSDIEQLHDVEYQIPLKVYSSDNLLLAQFGEKRRVPIKIEKVPQQLINAFLVAEDARFYSHPGVDYQGLIRAFFQLLRTGEKRQGGSTITMQVARNFLLSRKKTYQRKIKEIILALKIEQEYSKNTILELYLNKIYLGHRAYGVAVASSIYYGKDLSALKLEQLAMIASLPKAPSAYNPITNPNRAIQRRNYILRRMLALAYINQNEFAQAVKQPVTAALDSVKSKFSAPYIAEMVRKKMVEQYNDRAYTSGLKIFTTIDSSLQLAAIGAVRSALHDYDHRHGYRSLPHANKILFTDSEYSTVGDTYSAQVVELNDEFAIVKLADQSLVELSLDTIKWFRATQSANFEPLSISALLKPNDLIKIRQLSDKSWRLSQVPETEATLVALDSKNGAILALTGGFDYFYNKYNRATQSKRQPGSGFKPIIYTTALENGYTPASLISDAPIVIDDPSQENIWRPENYSKKFFGMTVLRVGLLKSRNLISIRLLRNLGIKKVIETAQRFGLTRQQLPYDLSLALGSGYATPLQMATIYSVFANGGFLIEPYFIERIENHQGDILFQASPNEVCPLCSEDELNDPTYTYAPRVISPQVNFLMNSLLRDVVKRGTATRAKVLARNDLAGKTGTTNEQRDAWFNGFSSGIVATTWLGFDNTKPLGRNETGGKAALPIWIEFMKTALKDRMEQVLQVPEGIVESYINPKTGLLAEQSKQEGVWEFFPEQLAPTEFSALETESDAEEESEDSLF